MENVRRTLLIAVLPVLGCGKQSGLDGLWMHRLQPPLMASGEDLELHQDGETVTGSGRYLVEAGPGGQLRVNGTIQGKQLRLVLERDSGQTTTYVATLQAANILEGAFSDDTMSRPSDRVVFVRNTGAGVPCPMYCIVGPASCTLSNGSCIFSCNQCICEGEGGHWSAGVGCP